MTNPARNRLHGYEAGWLTLLVEMGVASEKEAREAQRRVAQAAIDEMREQRKKQAERKRRRKRDSE
jgi:hypothetical protein